MPSAFRMKNTARPPSCSERRRRLRRTSSSWKIPSLAAAGETHGPKFVKPFLGVIAIPVVVKVRPSDRKVGHFGVRVVGVFTDEPIPFERQSPYFGVPDPSKAMQVQS